MPLTVQVTAPFKGSDDLPAKKTSGPVTKAVLEAILDTRTQSSYRGIFGPQYHLPKLSSCQRRGSWYSPSSDAH